MVTLTAAVLTRFSASRASDETASAASLSPLEALSRRAGGLAQPGQRLLDRAAECVDHRRDRLAALRARGIGLRLHGGQALALDHIVAEHHHRARHGADLVVRPGRRNARRSVAVGEPLHHLRQAFQRPRDRTADAPAEADADQHHGQADPENEAADARPRRRQRRAGIAGAVARRGDDLVGFRQHGLGIVADQRHQRLDIVGRGDPLREGVAVGLHLLVQLLLHRRRAVDRLEQRVEIPHFVEEVLLGGARARQAGIPISSRRMVRSDISILRASTSATHDRSSWMMLLHRAARRVELGGDALGVVVAERFLLVDQAFEAGLEVAHGDAQRRDHVLCGGAERGGDAVERFHRQLLAVGEIRNLLVGRPRDIFGRRRAHDQEAGLEIAAGIRHPGVALHAVEGAADFGVADHKRDAVGEKSDHRNDAEHDDAGANRQF